MSDRTEMLRQRAAEERKRLTDVFDVLEDEVDEIVDWRKYVRREPAVAVGLALAAGALAGAMSAPRRRSGPARRSTLFGLLSAGVASNGARSLLREAAPWVLEIAAAGATAFAAKRQKRRAASPSSPQRPSNGTAGPDGPAMGAGAARAG